MSRWSEIKLSNKLNYQIFIGSYLKSLLISAETLDASHGVAAGFSFRGGFHWFQLLSREYLSTFGFQWPGLPSGRLRNPYPKSIHFIFTLYLGLDVHSF